MTLTEGKTVLLKRRIDCFCGNDPLWVLFPGTIGTIKKITDTHVWVSWGEYDTWFTLDQIEQFLMLNN